ncbi:MAG: amino acid transporter [Desulfofustis sp. PB-SRB1]|jgi:L-lysine exporter family protein LysE/ArgO|nr:amino acid transporter [Desulfofustis sp. PB-SRB1]
MSAFWAGLSLGLSLIIVIGSQNAFVLKQGLKRRHVFVICLLCALSDAILMAVGVSGFSFLITANPWLETIARYGGALFLFTYGMISFYSAISKNQTLAPAGEGGALLPAIGTCLALTWLKPHVYLDTVVLFGAVSTQYAEQRLFFFLGGVSGSFLFFFTLGYGARLLRPLFASPRAWKLLDTAIGLIMWTIGYSLIFGISHQ